MQDGPAVEQRRRERLGDRARAGVPPVVRHIGVSTSAVGGTLDQHRPVRPSAETERQQGGDRGGAGLRRGRRCRRRGRSACRPAAAGARISGPSVASACDPVDLLVDVEVERRGGRGRRRRAPARGRSTARTQPAAARARPGAAGAGPAALPLRARRAAVRCGSGGTGPLRRTGGASGVRCRRTAPAGTGGSRPAADRDAGGHRRQARLRRGRLVGTGHGRETVAHCGGGSAAGAGWSRRAARRRPTGAPWRASSCSTVTGSARVPTRRASTGASGDVAVARAVPRRLIPHRCRHLLVVVRAAPRTRVRRGSRTIRGRRRGRPADARARAAPRRCATEWWATGPLRSVAAVRLPSVPGPSDVLARRGRGCATASARRSALVPRVGSLAGPGGGAARPGRRRSLTRVEELVDRADAADRRRSAGTRAAGRRRHRRRRGRPSSKADAAIAAVGTTPGKADDAIDAVGRRGERRRRGRRPRLLRPTP